VRICHAAAIFLFLFVFASLSRAGENLKINPRLDYSSDSNDGPLITGDHMDAGAAADRVNYVLIYGEGCYNSKRQARRTVALYEKYRGRVNFVIVDLDQPLSPAQSELVRSHYKGSIPHVAVLDKTGKPAYDAAGEVSEAEIEGVGQVSRPIEKRRQTKFKKTKSVFFPAARENRISSNHPH